MAESLLEIWLDLTIGKVAPERTHQFKSLKPGPRLSTGADAGGGSLQDVLDFRPTQDVVVDQGIQESKENCATDD
jgi:hypothetical protein